MNPLPPDSQRWTREAFFYGIRATLPLLPAMVAFAMVFGALAAQRGFSVAETTVMSGIVYAGMLQLIAVGVWPDQLTPGALLSLVILTLTVNSRFLLMSAAMRPWFGSLPAWQSYPMLSINTDANWIISTRYNAEGGTDPAFYVGSVVIVWITWVGTTIPGYYIGALIADPLRFGLDLVMPAFFAAMLVPIWRGPRKALPWAIAGAVALATDWLGFGWWFIVAGAVAGMLTGALLDDE
jgi:4-azaleucine resistance transporter AzlC